jgi:hypothetical protein
LCFFGPWGWRMLPLRRLHLRFRVLSVHPRLITSDRSSRTQDPR